MIAKALYKPVGTVAGIAGGLLAGVAFRYVWRKLSGDDHTPDALRRSDTWTEVVLAAMIQGAIFGAVKTAIDRASASGFNQLTGAWPGDDDS